MINSLEIGKAICSLLDNVQAFPIVAPIGTEYPFVVYTLTSLQKSSTKDSYNYREVATVMIEVLAATYEDSVALAGDIRGRLDGFSGDVKGLSIYDTQLTGASASYSPGVYIHSLTYNIAIV